MDLIFSSHFQLYLSFEDFTEAFEDYYLPSCEEQNITPKLEQTDFEALDLSDFEDDLIDVILIEAEDCGFNIEEHKSIESVYS